MITAEIFLETVGMQFAQLTTEVEQLRAKVDLLGPNAKVAYAAELDTLLAEKDHLAEALKNLSLATADEFALREAQVSQEFERLQQELHQLKAELSENRANLLLTAQLTHSIGWAEGMAEDNPIESIGWAEGMAAANPHESMGWAEGMAEEDVVESIGWAEGYKHD